ncbi:unnamed protein product [Allacma fusca]|uniref:Uncharacterized protein n=1 Tax=Allacma fusca TaxID=39272 RepID=A0A8J2PCM7_9HEXA|nr:unnamed protein product [Allacma fusca]
MRILFVVLLVMFSIFYWLYPVEGAAFINPCGRYGHDHHACARHCRSRPCPRNGLYQGVRAESGTCTFGSCICHYSASRSRTC